MSVVIVGLLLLVLVTTYARNMDTQRLLLQGESNVQCGGISAAIARLYTNRATISEQLHIEKQAELKRVEGKPGGILVGGVSCSYAGTVEVDGISDTAGVTLAVGNWCLEKSDSVIEISQGECP